MQQYGVNYWETYSPTVNWISVHFLMIVAQVIELDTQVIDFVLAFPHAKLEVPSYMELLAGMDPAGHGKKSSEYLLKLKRSLYGLTQASMNWNCKLQPPALPGGTGRGAPGAPRRRPTRSPVWGATLGKATGCEGNFGYLGF